MIELIYFFGALFLLSCIFYRLSLTIDDFDDDIGRVLISHAGTTILLTFAFACIVHGTGILYLGHIWLLSFCAYGVSSFLGGHQAYRRNQNLPSTIYRVQTNSILVYTDSEAIKEHLEKAYSANVVKFNVTNSTLKLFNSKKNQELLETLI